jgi:cytochrome P450
VISGGDDAGHEALDAQPPGPPPADTPLRRARHYGWMLVDPIGVVKQRFDRYGDIYRVQLGEHDLYVIKHPAHIEQVLVGEGRAFGKGHTAFARLGEVLGDSLLTSAGDAWRRQRRLVQPAFTAPRLAEYAEAMAEEAAACADELSALDDRVVDLSARMTGLTLRIVTRTLFGQRVDDSPRVARAMSYLNEAFGTPDLFPARRRRQVQAATRDLDAAVFDLIARRKAELERGGAPPGDLLQRLLDARDDQGGGRGLSEREIRDQLVTLYLAGHDTTSHALSWTFYLLSQNPEALADLRSELQRVLGDRPPRHEDLPQLPYTRQAIQEAMRIYPPVMAIPRRAEREARIGPYRVPAGSEVIIWVYRTHHDPRYYPDPERYLPQRFQDTETDERPRHAYLPFGAGQRACIGQLFAMIEAQLIVATLLQRCEFRYARRRPAGMRLGVTLAPKGGLPMRVKRRE